MTTTPDQPEHDPIQLSADDAEVLDQLINGGSPDTDDERAQRMRGLLDVLAHWQTPEADSGLCSRTLTSVLTADPASLSELDGEALDAILALRATGSETGPMPADSAERAERVDQLLGLLNRSTDEPLPGGLADRTMQAIERDRAEQRQLAALAGQHGGHQRDGRLSIRQIAATAALLLMVVSVLLPILDKGRRDAMIAQCSANLAGLGIDIQRLSEDRESKRQINELHSADREFRETGVRPNVPPTRVKLDYLVDNQFIASEHLVCPSVNKLSDNPFYNGQNSIVGGITQDSAKPRPVFADANPLYRYTANGLVRNLGIPGLTRSANHNGDGQNVLFNDGSVRWTIQPVITRPGIDDPDNIWVLQPKKDKAEGKAQDNTDKQEDDPDVFLTP